MPKTILLVEDEAIIALNEAKIIESHGFEVVAVYDGAGAVETAVSRPEVSLVLMDIDLGRGMTGTAAAQAILAEIELPIVFLTGHAEKEMVEKVKGITRYGYVLKNSGEFVLMESINMAFELFEANQKANAHLKKSQEAYRQLQLREERLDHLNRVLRSIRKINSIITQANETSLMLEKTCEFLVETSGYHKVWIILTDHGKPKKPYYHIGFDGAFQAMEEKLERGEIPPCAEEAMSSGRVVVNKVPLTGCADCPFSRQALFDGCEADDRDSITAPLIHNEKVHGWIGVILPSFYTTDEEEQRLFKEIADDLAFALSGQETKNKKSRREHEVQHLKDLFQYIIEYNPNAIAILDTELRYIYVSNRFLDEYGGERDKIIGKKHYEIFPDIPEKWRAVHRKALQGEVSSSDDDFYIKSDGSTNYIRWECRPWYAESGAVGGIVLYTENLNLYKRIQEEIKEKEAKLRITLQSIGDAVVSTDTLGRIVEMNPAAEELSGWSFGEAQGQEIEIVFPLYESERREPIESLVAQIKTNGRMLNSPGPLLLVSKDQREYLISHTISPIRTHQGQISGIVCIFRDMSSQHKSEIALKERAKELNCLYQMAQIVEEPDISIEEILQKTADILPRSWLHSDIAVCRIQYKDTHYLSPGFRTSEWRMSSGLTVQGKKAGHVEVYYLEEKPQLDEGPFLIEERRLLDTVAERLGRIISRKQTEEELAESETRWQFALDNAGDGLWDWDASSNKVFFSRKWKEILGYRQDEISGELSEWECRIHPEDREQCFRDLEAHFNGTAPVYENIHRLKCKDGSYKWILDRGKVVKRAEDGSPLRVIGTHLDISESKAMEEKLHEALHEKDVLMKELNHRIKNNLLMISSLISLKGSILGDKSGLADIKSQIDAIRIVHEKLFQTEHINEVQLKDYFLDLASSIFSSFTARKVELQWDVANITVPTKTAITLGLILNEIATNAIKHGFREGEAAEFKVGLHTDRKHDLYQLTIANSGNPFPAEIEINTSETLGLQLITTLVSQLNGTVELKKEPETLFAIRFPISG